MRGVQGDVAAEGGVLNALTIDWEDWYHGLLDRPELWDGFPPRLPAVTDALLATLEEADVKATFFVLGHAAERHPDAIRRMHAAGHEIASHGHSHRFVHNQSRDEFRSETERSAGFLGDLIGEPILGYRASTFTVTQKTLWALDVIEDCGFRYDSSIFPVRGVVYGIPTAPRFPHRLEGRDLWEVPPTTARVAGTNWPVAGGFYLRLLPLGLLRGAYARLNRGGHPVVFYVHPWEFDLAQPRGEYTGLWRIARYWGLRTVPRRFGALLDGFRWGTVRDLLNARRPSSAE
jgi:polysaccharide deacetylase family protein (PEP-CTERM system associated)